MPITARDLAYLFEQLSAGWSPEDTVLLESFSLLLLSRLPCNLDLQEINNNYARLRMSIESMHLLGAEDICILVLGGSDISNMEQMIHRFLHDAVNPESLLLVFCFSEPMRSFVTGQLPSERCVLLSESDAMSLFSEVNSLALLKSILLNRLSRYRLNPFQTFHPVDGNMFFGREYELKRLKHNVSTSFAIVGPGESGKTSLLKRHARILCRQKDARTRSCYYVNFYDCMDYSPDGVARFLATEIDASSRGYRTSAAGLIHFLQYQRSRHGHPLELLLDEVDNICQGVALCMIGEAANQGICRMILAGKRALLRATSQTNLPFGCRLELLRIEPLDVRRTRDLLVLPLNDLGFRLADENSITDRIANLTGRIPHMVQIIGNFLVNKMLKERRYIITHHHLDELENDYGITHHFIAPLQPENLPEPLARFVALTLLQENLSRVSPNMVKQLVQRARLEIDFDLCIRDMQ